MKEEKEQFEEWLNECNKDGYWLNPDSRMRDHLFLLRKSKQPITPIHSDPAGEPVKLPNNSVKSDYSRGYDDGYYAGLRDKSSDEGSPD